MNQDEDIAQWWSMYAVQRISVWIPSTAQKAKTTTNQPVAALKRVKKKKKKKR